jgi:5-methylcytosine-specific restriction endonuclease McrA
VFVRDDGRCAFAGPDGTRCGSRYALQVDHVHPFALGGRHNASNLRLLCAQHNRLAAEKALGPRVARYIQNVRRDAGTHSRRRE